MTSDVPCLWLHTLHPPVQDTLPEVNAVFALLGDQDLADLFICQSRTTRIRLVGFLETTSHTRIDNGCGNKRTSSGGLRPSFLALSQRSRRVMPAQGPYLDVMSKTRRMSVVVSHMSHLADSERGICQASGLGPLRSTHGALWSSGVPRGLAVSSCSPLPSTQLKPTGFHTAHLHPGILVELVPLLAVSVEHLALVIWHRDDIVLGSVLHWRRLGAVDTREGRGRACPTKSRGLAKGLVLAGRFGRC